MSVNCESSDDSKIFLVWPFFDLETEVVSGSEDSAKECGRIWLEAPIISVSRDLENLLEKVAKSS